MSKEPVITNTCKQRFKGVENFLRKVAFNLGNSPSQTEVKIISCIPIDVTDLQQKIINLEKELEEARAGRSPPAPESVVQTVTCARYSRPPAGGGTPDLAERCEPPTAAHSRADYPPPDPAPPHLCNCWSSDMSHSLELLDQCDVPDCKKNIFKKSCRKKKPCKSKDNKTKFVYYAQTSTSPFLTKKHAEKRPKQTDEIECDYVSRIIEKQYTSVPIAKEYSITSQFSTPVCRDGDVGGGAACEPDMCSCCRGAFHNIDRAPAAQASLEPLPTYLDCNAGFYDSSMYDMVPVKEKTVKTPVSYHQPAKRTILKSDVFFPYQYYNEKARPQMKYNPYIVNYSHIPNTFNIANKAPTKMQPKKNRVRWLSPNRNENITTRIQRGPQHHDTESSKSCSVDCGSVYLKRTTVCGKPISLPVMETKTLVSHKNAECLTICMNDSTCQTTTTTSVQIDSELDDKKTEETLNQIKSILQSVLTEVKTNARNKKVQEEKPMKDAVVQKSTSQGHMPGGSTMMGSFTYSPYNMNPYLPTCSRQLNTNVCCYPNAAYAAMNKCMQNFPVFIQSTARPMCTSCVRSNNAPKPVNTATGNTKVGDYSVGNTRKVIDERQNNETKTLIKEIYKSMAVNMMAPAKDTSASEYDELKTARQVSTNKSLCRPSGGTEGVKIFMKPSVASSRNAQKWSPPVSALNSKLISNTVTVRSQGINSTSTTETGLKNRIESFQRNTITPQTRNELWSRTERVQSHKKYEDAQETSSISEDEEESTETESDDIVIVPHQNIPKQSEKKGLFSKIFRKSTNLFTAKNKKSREHTLIASNVREEESEEEDTASDRTVCSGRRGDPPHWGAGRRGPARTAHRHTRGPPRARREPYMEQEYRRQWNEKLMFREKQQRITSENRYCRESDPRFRQHLPHPPHPQHPYWQHYEARSALVGHAPPASHARPVAPRPQPLPPRAPHLASHAPPLAASLRPTARQLRRKSGPKLNVATKGLSWLKRHKMGIHCGEQWKRFVLEG